ncbi:hypothetical protein TNCV_4653871 [Trichonephila clavipes]|nr:hypothetical protein TNCV_4653871 [Trichonephila clavipes]
MFESRPALNCGKATRPTFQRDKVKVIPRQMGKLEIDSYAKSWRGQNQKVILKKPEEEFNKNNYIYMACSQKQGSLRAQVHIVRAQEPPSGEKTLRQNYLRRFGIRLYGTALKRDTSFRECIRFAMCLCDQWHNEEYKGPAAKSGWVHHQDLTKDCKTITLGSLESCPPRKIRGVRYATDRDLPKMSQYLLITASNCS